jgi:two-component system, chemotaxis family, protein-glutamate methylesterase/glutaminase
MDKSNPGFLGPVHDLVVIGASAGGVEALQQLVSGLPADFPACVLVVLHIGRHESRLAHILSRVGKLPAANATHGEALRPGHIYVAVPDHHLQLRDGRIAVTRGARENHSRPAIDPLFRSAAVEFRSRVIAVLLSGANDDGTAGLQAVASTGGVTVVQDPDDALTPDMPRSALLHAPIDHCLPAREIANLLARLAGQRAPAPKPLPARLFHEHAASLLEDDPMPHLEQLGQHSAFVCPECGGSLTQLEGAKPPRFRCHTGHAFSLSSLHVAQEESTEAALWAAIRALQEKETLLRRMADLDRLAGDPDTAQGHEESASQLLRHVQLLREMIEEKP